MGGGECIKLLKTKRCQIFCLFKTSQHLDEDYLLADNSSFHENGESKKYLQLSYKNHQYYKKLLSDICIQR